jgi:hypothetical protein
VHQEILVSTSNFFKAALSGRWKESLGAVDLPEQLPWAFNVYVEFLYSGKLYVQQLDKDTGTTEDAEWDYLFELYFLSDAIMDSSLMNTVIDALIEKVRELKLFPLSCAKLVYHNTAEASTLRRLLVDLHIYLGSADVFDKESQTIGDVPTEFLFDVLSGAKKVGAALYDTKTAFPWDVDQCMYHAHEDGKRCNN